MSRLNILVIDDEKLICWSFKQQLKKEGYSVETAESGEEGLERFKEKYPDVVFLDNKLPGKQGLELIREMKALKEDCYIIFMTAYGTIETAVMAMKMGAFEYVNKPFNFDEIELILENIEKKINLDNELQILRREQQDKLNFNHIIGTSKSMKRIIDLAKKISQSEATTVLLLGESGTGKDLLARIIHNNSNRKDKSFVTINCASLPETLLESELFGHERGAFTDAKTQKKGLFEVADGGTVYLDEIGEVNVALQVKLLNVLESRVFRRLGGTEDIRVNIRIIAATNQDLNAAIEQKKFRNDLYYRLKVFQLTMPPIRERREDIPLLVEYFIQSFNKQFRKNIKGVTENALNVLMNYSWPGNVRELRNVIERAIILETDEWIDTDNLPSEISGVKPPTKITDVEKWLEIPEEGFSIYEIEKSIIEMTLQKSGYNQTRAAEMMGVTRDTLRYKIKKYNISQQDG